MTPTPQIELLHVPECPLVDRVRAIVEDCLRDAGLAATVKQREGSYPSPTLLIDGVDVVTGQHLASGVCCRLDLPSRQQIEVALARPEP